MQDILVAELQIPRIQADLIDFSLEKYFDAQKDTDLIRLRNLDSSNKDMMEPEQASTYGASLLLHLLFEHFPPS